LPSLIDLAAYEIMSSVAKAVVSIVSGSLVYDTLSTLEEALNVII